MNRRILGIGLVIALLTVTFLFGKKSDWEVLGRVSQVATAQVRSALPETSSVAAPLVALRPGRMLPIEEQVRLRIETDKAMNGATVTVTSPESGVVRLRGIVPGQGEAQRANQLAEGTVGVESVLNEIAFPQK